MLIVFVRIDDGTWDLNSCCISTASSRVSSVVRSRKASMPPLAFKFLAVTSLFLNTLVCFPVLTLSVARLGMMPA